MKSKRYSLILLAAFGLTVIAFIGLAINAGGLLGKQSQKMVDLKLQNHVADAQLASLSNSKKQVEQYAYFNDVAKTVLPSDKDQAEAVSEIFQIASDSGINIQSLSFPSSTLGGGSTSSTTGASNAATAAPSTVISQAKPYAGVSGLYYIPLTISPQSGKDTPPDKLVTFNKFLTFLKGIEKNRRTAQITSVNVTPPDSNNPGFNFTLIVNIFLKP